MKKETIDAGGKEIELVVYPLEGKWVVVAYEWVADQLKPSIKHGSWKLPPQEFDTEAGAEDFYGKTLLSWR